MSVKSTKMPGRVRFVAASLILSALVAGCGSSTKPAESPKGEDVGTADASIGSQAPELVADSVAGDGPTTLAEANDQIVIVDFWATFCEPCRKSFPKYQELVDKYSGDVVVIAVSVDDPDDVSEDDIKNFADELNVSFPIVWDKTKATADIYSPPKMPTSYIIDKEGIVQHIHAGYSADESDEISEEIDALLAE